MNPEKKEHLSDDGSIVEILHFCCPRSRGCGDPTLLFYVLPQGYVATKEEWGIYRWKDDTGKQRHTVRRRAADRTSVTWRAKEAHAAIAAAEDRVRKLQEELKAAEGELGRLQLEAQGADDKLFDAVNREMPTFQAFFDLPDVQNNPRILLKNWSHAKFTMDQISAARQAVISRRPKQEWPLRAAQWFIATTSDYDIETVQRYYTRAVAKRKR